VDVWEQYTHHNDVSQLRAVLCAEVYIIALAHNERMNYKHTVSGMYVYAVANQNIPCANDCFVKTRVFQIGECSMTGDMSSLSTNKAVSQ